MHSFVYRMVRRAVFKFYSHATISFVKYNVILYGFNRIDLYFISNTWEYIFVLNNFNSETVVKEIR